MLERFWEINAWNSCYFLFLLLYTKVKHIRDFQATEIDTCLIGSDSKRYCIALELLGNSEIQCAAWARRFLLVLNDYVSYDHVFSSMPRTWIWAFAEEENLGRKSIEMIPTLKNWQSCLQVRAHEKEKTIKVIEVFLIMKYIQYESS